jgi:hypothetical protein
MLEVEKGIWKKGNLLKQKIKVGSGSGNWN